MTSPILAHPPGDCCFTGFKHSGTPVGHTISIGGMETYISEPKAQSAEGHKKVILFFADIHGPLYLNNQLIQDYFSSHGMHEAVIPCK